MLLQQLEDTHGVFQRRVSGGGFGVGILPRILRICSILAVLHFAEQPVSEFKLGINNKRRVGVLGYVLHIVIARIPLHVVEYVIYHASDEGNIAA